MSNILLVEPDYRSKFPPLGLMRLSTYHQEQGDSVTFVRGKVPSMKEKHWHKIYVSSLFTYELPRTVATAKYYLASVDEPTDITVGGIGATLMPEYIRQQVGCKVIEGPLDAVGKLHPDSPAIADYLPDYDIISSVDWSYKPENSYFCRATRGCIRKCKFCAVPRLEPDFGYCDSITSQIEAIKSKYGEKQHLVLLDNNVLAIDTFHEIIAEIRDAGFHAGATRKGRRRTVDFNQGIDARLITPEKARDLATICLSPVRLAFDRDSVEEDYTRAIRLLAAEGFSAFTNYVMFNFEDTPQSLYYRMSLNTKLSAELDIKVTGFPMRFVPIDDVNRRYVSPEWRWRYLRGIQCVLLATHGMVSPSPRFFRAAFGRSYGKFVELLSMPDRYIIHREKYKKEEAADWRRLYRALSDGEKEELLEVLARLNGSRDRRSLLARYSKYAEILDHYYPDGETPHD